MTTRKKEWSRGREDAGHYRRKAEDADRAAETAETAEAKQFYQEMAKNYYLMADGAYSGAPDFDLGPVQSGRAPPAKQKSGWFSFLNLWGATPKIRK